MAWSKERDKDLELCRQLRYATPVDSQTVTKKAYLRLKNPCGLDRRPDIEGHTVYGVSYLCGGRKPTEVQIDELTRRVSTQHEFIMANHRAAFHGELFAIVNRWLEALYEDFQRLCDWYPVIDGAWDLAYVEKVASCAGKFMRAEASLWDRLRAGYRTLEPELAHNAACLLPVLSFKHGTVSASLQKLKSRCDQERYERRGGNFSDLARATARYPVDALRRRAKAFVEADELEYLAHFAHLVEHDRAYLPDFTATADSEHGLRDFAHKLWSVVDLVLAEDLAGNRSDGATATRPAGGSRPWLQALSAHAGLRGRVRALIGLLDNDNISPYLQNLENKLEKSRAELGFEPQPADVRSIWRGLVLAHPSPMVRHLAVREAKEKDLWQDLWRIVAYPKAPLACLTTIARLLVDQQQEEREDGGIYSDYCKIFFDCLKGRLRQTLATVEHRHDLTELVKLIGHLYGVSVFVEAEYFEELETLFNLMSRPARQLAVNIDRIESAVEELASRRGGRHWPTREPQCASELPPAVQRHLAREGCYLKTFAHSSDPRIARETLQFINEENVASVLEGGPPNASLLRELIKQPDLMRTDGALIKILKSMGGGCSELEEPNSGTSGSRIDSANTLSTLDEFDLALVIKNPGTPSLIKRKMTRLMKERRQKRLESSSAVNDEGAK